jgi:hypothetical protein
MKQKAFTRGQLYGFMSAKDMNSKEYIANLIDMKAINRLIESGAPKSEVNTLINNELQKVYDNPKHHAVITKNAAKPPTLKQTLRDWLTSLLISEQK